MKRIGNLYGKIYDVDNIRLAIRNASKGKRNRRYVARILANEEHYANQISEMLKTGTYQPRLNRTKVVYDTSSRKERNITIPAFYPDQIIQWATVQVLQQILSKGMYRYSCGSVPGRGGLAAKKYVERVQKRKDARYVLKLDIRKFFPSVRHDRLKAMLATKIKDRETLDLLGKIIDNGGEGLPIGYYTSQWLSNFYLQEIDHYIKEELQVKYYVRYVDDMVLWGVNKRKLRKSFYALRGRLKDYGLEVKGNWQLWKSDSRPLDFVGYRFRRWRTTLRKRIFLRLNAVVRKIKGYGLNIHRAMRFTSLIGWCKRIPFRNYYVSYIRPILRKKRAKLYIALWTVRHNAERRNYDRRTISIPARAGERKHESNRGNQGSSGADERGERGRGEQRNAYRSLTRTGCAVDYSSNKL